MGSSLMYLLAALTLATTASIVGVVVGLAWDIEHKDKRPDQMPKC